MKIGGGGVLLSWKCWISIDKRFEVVVLLH